MEIIGDILKVVQEGSTRPTQIMHAANLTWPPLMVQVEVLLRNQLLARETDGSRSTYRLTSKGSAVLSTYLRLKAETDILTAEAAEEQRLGGLAERPSKSLGRKTLSALRSGLVAANFRVLDNVAVGRSGAEYSFSTLLEGPSKSKYGFVLLDEVDESAVIGIFVRQLDTDVDLSVVYTKSVTDGARRIAALDSIPVLSARDLAGLAESLTFLDGFRSRRSLLLEVDPSENYERVMEELVRREGERCDVSVLTWKGSRVYSAIARTGKVTVHVVTGSSGTARAGRQGETRLTPRAQASMMEFVEASSRKTPERGSLLIFDGVSELLNSIGREEALLFLKRALRILSASGQRSVFTLKGGLPDDRDLGLVRKLLPTRLTYYGSGLRLASST